MKRLFLSSGVPIRRYGPTIILCFASFLILSELNAYLLPARQVANQGIQLHVLGRLLPEFDNNPLIDQIVLLDSSGRRHQYGIVKKEKKPVGVVFELKVSDRRSPFFALVGADQNGLITGMILLNEKETKSFRAPAFTTQWLSQFKGLKASQIQLRRFGGSIDPMPGNLAPAIFLTDSVRSELQFFNNHRNEILRLNR